MQKGAILVALWLALGNQHSAHGTPGSSTFSPQAVWAKDMHADRHDGCNVRDEP